MSGTLRGDIHSACPYCGVGCGIVAGADGAVRGDAAHPANRGRLCVKGAQLAATIDDAERLRHPLVRGTRTTWDTALDTVASRFAETIAMHGPDSVAFYVSGQFLTEDYYVANKLMKGFIGSANIDTNSRLCMASTVAAQVRAFGEDVVPGVYEDLEEADLLVLVGSNAAWCHPVLFQRAQAARRARGSRLVVIEPRRTATAEAADLFLQIAPGTDVLLFQHLLVTLEAAGAIDHAWAARHTSGLDGALAAAHADAADPEAVAAACGIDPEALETFCAWFADTERSVTAWSQGVNQSEAGTDAVNAIINCHLATARIGRPGMGPFSLTGQPNAMGGREVGGLANQLAAHLRFDDPADRALLREFWRAPALPERPGLKAVELFDAVLDGRVKAIWIAATNPAASMPRAGRVQAALAACPFVVVSDCWPGETTGFADVLLPAAGWGEKDGTVTNSDRRISRQRAFRAPPGEARPDWWMFAEVARRMGFAEAFAWDGPAAIFREHARLSATGNAGQRVFDIGALAGLDDAGWNALPPLRWPLPAQHPGEGGRLFAAGGFPTPDGRARCVPVRHHPRGGAGITLNTGRLRDQWHTMTRTGRAPALMAHTSAPALTLNPADAAALGIADGDLARVSTGEGSMLLRAATSHAQRRGEAFAPMHWTSAFAAAGPVGQIVQARRDPHSGQPALKHTAARVEPVAESCHGLLLRAESGCLPADVLWVRVPVEGGQLYRLSLTGHPPDAAALARLAAALLPSPEGAELLEMHDARRGILRLALLAEDRLRACLMLAPTRDALPAEAALVALLGRQVRPEARALLLAGRAGSAAAEEGPRVCTCFGVSREAIRHAAVTHRLRSAAEIGALLGAGTNCGSCIPELEEILRDVREPAI